MMSYLQKSTPEGMLIRFNSCFTTGELKEMYDVFERNEMLEQKEKIIAKELRSFVTGLQRLNGQWYVAVGERFAVDDADPKRHCDVGLFAQFQSSAKHLVPLDLMIVRGLNKTGSLPAAPPDIGSPLLRLPISSDALPDSFHYVVRSLLASSTSLLGGICDRIARDIGSHLGHLLPTRQLLVIVGRSVNVLPPSNSYIVYWGTAGDLTIFVVQLGRL